MPRLTSQAVDDALTECLFGKGDDLSQRREVQGVVRTYVLHGGRLAAHRRLIEGLLAELPVQFRRSVGGGWSFLRGCFDRDDVQWTGVHATVEMLIVLGIAIGKVEFVPPREQWPVLPGGVPYFVIDM